MASVLLYPIVYGLEMFLASALSTQIALSLAAVLVSTAAVIYCQRTVVLWWSLKSTTTQTRTKIIRPHVVVEVTEVRNEQTTDRPRDRGGGHSSTSFNSRNEEKQARIEEPSTSSTTPITTTAATRSKLSDDSEGSTEGSINGEEPETRRRKSGSSAKEGQPEQSWLSRQPAYMHRSHWVAKPAQPRNNPLIFKPSLCRRASADNNGHHQHQAADFVRESDNSRKRDDDSHDAGERGGEKPQKPSLDRRSSFPSSLPSATFYSQSPRTQTSSSLVTTSLTSSSTSSSTATPSCLIAPLQSSSVVTEGELNKDPNVGKKIEDIKSCTSVIAVSQRTPDEAKTTSHARSASNTLPSVSVMAPATIHEESESAETSAKSKSAKSVKRMIPKLSFTTEVTSSSQPSSRECKDVGGKPDSEPKDTKYPKRPTVMPIICVESESDKSDTDSQSEGQATTRESSSALPYKSNDLYFQFSVKPVTERSQGTRSVSLGIPTAVKGEIAYPGAQKTSPSRQQSDPLTITVKPPVICEPDQAKDQNITQEVIRPIPLRTCSLGIPPVYTGEASFPMKQPHTECKDDETMDAATPQKPPGARRKESLEVPSRSQGEENYPSVQKALMGPPHDRPIKRHRPRSLDIPSLSATSPDETSADLPLSAPGAKRKHQSILKHGNSQDKPSRKKSVSFSPTVSPHALAPEFNFEHESDGAVYAMPKRPKMFRHYSIDASESSYRKERYRASGRQIAEANEAGILFTDDIPNISGISKTVRDHNSHLDDDSLTPSDVKLGSDCAENIIHPQSPDSDESDDVFISTRSMECSNAKARFLAAGGAKAVMSVLCTQDSSDSHGQGMKYSSVDLIEAEAKAIEHSETPTSEHMTTDACPTTEQITISSIATAKDNITAMNVLPEVETTVTTNMPSDIIKTNGRVNRFLANEDLNLRASLLFVETVRSSMESDLSEGRVSQSSEESECSGNEDVDTSLLTSAKSRFLQSCQITEIGPKHHHPHWEEIWNTPTIPELPEPLEIDSQDEESTSAARDADIDESTSSSSSPSYSSSWYGFLELDPSRPSLSNLGVEIIESTDNDIFAPIKDGDDTDDEAEYDRKELGDDFMVEDKRQKMRQEDSRESGEKGVCDMDKGDYPPQAKPETSLRLDVSGTAGSPFGVGDPAFASIQSCPGDRFDTDDVIRHQWQPATSPVSSPRLLRRHHYKTPIILDNGSEVLKAGLADGAVPSTTIPTVVGRLKKDIESFQHRSDVYIGRDLARKYGIVCVNHPMADGLIDSWDDLERIWDHVIREELKVTWNEHPILLTEIASAPRRQREKILELLFETYNAPACYVVNQGALALHANGETSGLVLSSGSGVTEIVPVYQGCTLSSAVASTNAAGKGVTRRLQRILMDERAFTTSTPSDHRIVREMKESMAYVCKDFESENKMAGMTNPIKYALPDGSSVTLRRKDLFHCAEMIFRPDLLGLSHQRGLMAAVKECLQKCDPDFLRSIDPTILLAGGNTKLRGFVNRLQFELTKDGIRRTVVAHDNRDITTWIGGAILASHSSFEERWITCEDFDEYGASLAHKQNI